MFSALTGLLIAVKTGSVTGLQRLPQKNKHGDDLNRTAGVHVNMDNVTFPNGSGLAQPSMSSKPPEHGCLFLLLFSPSDCLCIYFRSVQFVRCECVRSGSFKHCSKSIALIKGITSQKREKKNHKLLWGVVWSSKKRDIQSKCLSHCKQQYHREAFRAKKKKIIQAKIKERKERYVFTISPALSVYLADDETYFFWASQYSLGLQIPPVGHSGWVWPISYPGKCIYVFMCMWTDLLYVLCMCMFVC